MTQLAPATTTLRRPALRYYGGKWRSAPWVIAHFRPHSVYVEAFGGGGSVLMRKPRGYAEIYNDLDGEIVNFFQVLRDRPRELEFALRYTPFSREEFALRYTPFSREEFKQSFHASTDAIEQARRTAVRSAMSHSPEGLTGRLTTGFRTYTGKNRRGIPANDWHNFPPEIEAFAARLRGVIIENRPALELIREKDHTETCFYVDPPYPHGTRTRHHGGYRHEMSREEHHELLTALRSVRGQVVVSSYDNALYREMLAGWNMFTKNTFADGAARRTEVLWTNR